jgi:hypothetical protein
LPLRSTLPMLTLSPPRLLRLLRLLSHRCCQRRQQRQTMPRWTQAPLRPLWKQPWMANHCRMESAVLQAGLET